MEFYQTPDERVGIREIPPSIADLLRQIPSCIERGADAAENRLYPVPTANGVDDALSGDWQAYVQPELHGWFTSARQVVESDLRAMRETDGLCEIEFSLRHADAWLNALNQARLTLAEVHSFGEAELGRRMPEEILTERDLARFQIDLYAGIQYWLVEMLD